jgi:hypothetical protein
MDARWPFLVFLSKNVPQLSEPIRIMPRSCLPNNLISIDLYIVSTFPYTNKLSHVKRLFWVLKFLRDVSYLQQRYPGANLHEAQGPRLKIKAKPTIEIRSQEVSH